MGALVYPLGALKYTITFQARASGDVLVRVYTANPNNINQNNQSLVSIMQIAAADWAAMAIAVAGDTNEHTAPRSYPLDVGSLSPAVMG